MSNHVTKATFSADDLISISEFQRTPGEILTRVKRSKSPLAVTQRGHITAFLLNTAQYESLLTAHNTGNAVTTTDAATARKHALLHALEEMLPKIIADYRPEKILLFGSLARGNATESSDIDLVIIKRTTKRPIERRKDVWRIARPRIATDFFVYTPEEFSNSVKERRAFFAQELSEHGHILYEKNS